MNMCIAHSNEGEQHCASVGLVTSYIFEREL